MAKQFWYWSSKALREWTLFFTIITPFAYIWYPLHAKPFLYAALGWA